MTGGSDRCTGPSSDSLRTYVFGVRRRIAGRMVMGEDERRRRAASRRGGRIRTVRVRRVQRAAVDHVMADLVLRG
jgi:hypothetical protein